MVILTLLLGLGVARADFTGDFATAFWTNNPPGLGSVYFTNSDTELVLIGPNQPPSETTSVDPITYNGPLGGGLRVGGTVEFNWQYDSPDGLNDSAYFVWTPAGGESTQVLLAQGGGLIVTNTFSLQLAQGVSFEFVLFSDTPGGKPAASLVITDFQFLEIPEPSTGALLASMLTCLGAVRWRRSRPQASSQR